MGHIDYGGVHRTDYGGVHRIDCEGVHRVGHEGGHRIGYEGVHRIGCEGAPRIDCEEVPRIDYEGADCAGPSGVLLREADIGLVGDLGVEGVRQRDGSSSSLGVGYLCLHRTWK